MGGDRRSSKGGRYVGGFLQLFDWNSKSRKKLFSSKNDLPEHTKQGKRDGEDLPKSRSRLVDEDGTAVAYSVKESSDFSCASSVTDDDFYGSKAPSVVARLMGLDSLPSSNAMEPYSSPFSDSHSLQDAQPFSRKELEVYGDHRVMNSSDLINNVEGPSKSAIEPKPQKMATKPIEKFQTEVLPPRSAKSIPITHHKLLSPIKTPGFFPSKDAAHIMEAAAKIIDAGLQATPRSKTLSTGSSSVPLRVRDFREKLEAAQKPSRVNGESQRLVVDASSSKYLKGSSTEKSLSNSINTISFKFSSDNEEGSASVKNKARSVSLAVQAKVNVQKRESLSSSNRTLDRLKEPDGHSQAFKSQPHSLKSSLKKSPTHSTSGVLRQNNQKQNCSADKERLTSKTSGVNMRGRKTITSSSSHSGRQTSLGRDAGTSRSSRKSSLEARESDREIPYSKTENLPRKKRSIDVNLQYEKSYTVDNMICNASTSTQSSTVADRQFTFIEESQKKGMDVVSFTFTAPMTRSVAGSESSEQVGEKSSSFAGKHSRNMTPSSNSMELSSLGLNTIGADALSILLEQKLRELTHGFENSQQNVRKTGSSAVRRNFISANSECDIPRFQDNWSMDGQIFSALSLSEHDLARRKYKHQGKEDVAEYSSDRSEIAKLEDCLIPSPESVLEPFLLNESCYSFDSAASNSTLESKQYSSAQTQKESGVTSSTWDYTVEAEADLSDSASSISLQGKILPSSSEWELEYIKSIVLNVQVMFKDYALGRTHEVINPNLFDQLERRRNSCFQAAEEDNSRLTRKVVFDCASECLDLRCQQFVGSGHKMWAKGVAVMRPKGRLAEEVYREIQCWRSMGSRMVDELVDRDMSTQHGKWLDFEVDAFALGIEIESQICDTLIDEMIADILPYTRPRFSNSASAV